MVMGNDIFPGAAPSDGVWEPRGHVTHEDVRHMERRVQQFQPNHELQKQHLVGVPSCASSWARWLVVDSIAFSQRVNVPRALPLLKRRLHGKFKTCNIEERSQLYMSTLLARGPDTSLITGLCIFKVLSQRTEPSWKH